MTQPAEENHAGLTQPDSSPVHLQSPSSSTLPSASVPNLKNANGPHSLTTTRPILSNSDSFTRPTSVSSSGSRDRSYERSVSPSLGRAEAVGRSQSACRDLIIKSFAPRIAVHASPDVDEFIKGKGVATGLMGLLRPFGEIVSGKVIIRDSVGLSKAWDNFAVRFTGSWNSPDAEPLISLSNEDIEGDQRSLLELKDEHFPSSQPQTTEDLLNLYMDTRVWASPFSDQGLFAHDSTLISKDKGPSQLFTEFMRTLLSNDHIVPHETFGHPVACLVAVSSRSQAPIEVLRQLYAQTGRGNPNIPPWVGVEYLRYYILIHDEDKDDIAKSTALFDLMKRHFGLHCHLLRLRSSQCVPSDDDSFRVPLCEWLSASERLREAQSEDKGDDATTGQCVFESDAAAINSFIREMVTQSVVPFMESRVMTWNDQVASRRRGIGGRFMSMSKRWAGFGSSKAPNSGANSSNFNAELGYYPPDSPEVIMRQMADYAVMLRDYKLAHTTYDTLRSDFAQDKAWIYHAAANEFAALSSLLLPWQQSRGRSETIDQWLDAAVYSYLTRSSSPMGAVRCLTVATELISERGPAAADHVARWAGRLLELSILSPVVQALMAERMAEYYFSRMNVANHANRGRQAALWNITAALSWARLGRTPQARGRVGAASHLYNLSGVDAGNLPFPSMQLLWNDLITNVGERSGGHPAALDNGRSSDDLSTVQTEQLDSFLTRPDATQSDFGNLNPVDLEKPHVIANHQRHGSTLSAYDSDGFE